VAWQKSYALVLTVYRLTRSFPKEEQFGLTQQLRRAAVSVPSNIAEGWGRQSTADYVRFLKMALGSACEMETQLMIAQRLGYLTSDQLNPLMDLAAEVGRLTNGLLNSLANK